jgi:hypothetical protein
MKMILFVEYWEDILLHLSKLLLFQSSTLLKGLWPTNNWRFLLCQSFIAIHNGRYWFKKLSGPENLKPTPTYILFKDFNIWKFVLMRPHDPILVLILVLVWMRKTQSDVKTWPKWIFQNVKSLVMGIPMKKGSNLDEQHLWIFLEWQMKT